MSATIVKSMTTFKREDGKWYIRANTFENNVYPHVYHKWEGKNGYESREELEGSIVIDFLNGSFRGSSRYAAFVKAIQNGYSCDALTRYFRLSKINQKAFEKCVSAQYGSEEYNHYAKIEKRINDWKRDLYPAIGRAFREWQPDTTLYTIKVPNYGYVHSIGKQTFKYSLCSTYAPRFKADRAKEFCRRFSSLSPELIAVPA